MIIVKLSGGLGNQMFQYALGRNLSIKNKTELILDTSSYSLKSEFLTPRNYELDIYNIHARLASKKELIKIGKLQNNSTNFFKICYNKFYNSFFNEFNNYKVINEKKPEFESIVLNASNNIYLDGYWQSEKYFKDIENIIRTEFTIKTPISEENKKIANEIINSNSISIHVRRSDYVNNKIANKTHGICSLGYYTMAIEKITVGVSNPLFYVFSDDPEWTCKELKIKFPTIYITNNMDKNYEDLRLMSLCKHNIIANSSFSWWGAWLNQNVEKKIIAPQKWFNSEVIEYNINDILPQDWTKI